MSTGLIALLDDVAGLAKLAASSLDDVTAHASRAGVKAAGVVIDDAAVTPRYVVGLCAPAPDRARRRRSGSVFSSLNIAEVSPSAGGGRTAAMQRARAYSA